MYIMEGGKLEQEMAVDHFVMPGNSLKGSGHHMLTFRWAPAILICFLFGITKVVAFFDV